MPFPGDKLGPSSALDRRERFPTDTIEVVAVEASSHRSRSFPAFQPQPFPITVLN